MAPGPVCHRKEGTDVVVWVEATAASALSLSWNGRPLAVGGTDIDAGTRVALPPQLGFGEFVVERDDGARWRLALAPTIEPLLLREARELRQSSSRADALPILDHLLDGLLPPDVEARVRLFRGLVLRQLDRLDEAEVELLGAAATAFDVGHNGDACRALGVIAYATAFQRHRVPEARAWIDFAVDAVPPGRCRIWNLQLSALISGAEGDYRTAYRRADATDVWAHRFDTDWAHHAANSARLWLADELGRPQEMLAQLIVNRTRDRRMGCSSALRLGRAASAYTMIGEHELARLNRARALEMHRRDCGEPLQLATILVAGVREAVERGDLETADAWITELESLELERDESELRTVVEAAYAERALRDDDMASAKRHFESARSAARRDGALTELRRAEIGLARVAAREGRLSDARRSFETAAAILDRMAPHIPIGDGRGAWEGDPARGARHHVDFLLTHDSPEQALTVVRRIRRRLLAGVTTVARLYGLSVAERQHWTGAKEAYRTVRAQMDARRRDSIGTDAGVPTEVIEALERHANAAIEPALSALGATDDRLAPAQPGAVTLAWFPLPEGWVGFAAGDEGVTAVRFAAIDFGGPPEDVAEVLLTPFAEAIAGASRIRVLAYADIRAVDVHALPFRGRPLVAHAPVVYPLDVAVTPARPHRATAVVIGDTRGDLPVARRHAQRVTARLEAAGFRVRAFEGSTWIGISNADRIPPARLPDVLEALADADLLWFDGHGTGGSVDGWESGLAMADGESLRVGDILTADAVPAHVVLSGCETGLAGPEAPGESLSVAAAFVARGSRTVLASTRRVADDESVLDAVAAQLRPVGDIDLAEILHTAVRDAPTADWAAWRAFTP